MMSRMMEPPDPPLVVKIEIVTRVGEAKARRDLKAAIEGAGYRLNEITFEDAPQ